MPTYEYMCEKCEHEFEREQRISDPPVKTCPECRSRKVKKLISRTSSVLKGSGWYSDLYSSPKAKGGDKGADAKSDDATPAKTEPSESKKSESKTSADSSGSGSEKSPAKGKKGKSAA